MKALAILGVKNEGAFLIEWLAHHRAVGFTDFLVYSNDCSDGTDAMLDRLQALGWLTHVRNDGPHAEGPQWALLKAAEQHPLKAAADWVLFCDIDEFVNIHAGDRTLGALLAALPEADAITLTWRMFGNAGVIEFADQPVTQTFTRAAPETLAWPWRAQLFKTLFRNDGRWRKLGVHRPRSPAPGVPARWFDGSGREIADLAAGQRIFSDYTRPNYGLVQLNHYALGAMQSYLVKCDRGRANREASGFDMGYWVERNLCAAEDRTILALDSSALRDGLHADPVLGALHAGAVRWRQDRFAALMAEESWRALFGRLLMCPPSQALDRAAAAALLAHQRPAPARGPG
ncbi:glycosyltransferase family 2 protein [Tabrizicola oligotrophica]|uniref:Glycosyltransferase family 2 protein n=1 Tax=Tabrizicola oligotrophica TaxID=2710650 RepID=A0A6M0QMX1_9RHOB|nr:glycosyltransferase family 2 protein [Tabrizicola oligotrophica]NEY88709.1 glycosyltransferase family 2 protein [Tabrizicola oligotrophica]